MAGMALIDSTDSILMLGAYGWAFVKPIRKLYYNLTITFVSVLVALLVGGIEVLGLIGDHLKIQGYCLGHDRLPQQQFRHDRLRHHRRLCRELGVSILIYRLKRYDEIEVRTSPAD